NPEYNRLTFAIFGVATPSDLIRDRNRTPFNIGTAIALSGFSLEEIEPLARGLPFESGNKREIIKHILYWTNGQPFLTQKICHIIGNFVSENKRKISVENAAFWIENIARNYIIYGWQSKDEPEHLKTIRDRLLRNPLRTGRLLGIYQDILQNHGIKFDNSREYTELILSGIAVKNGEKLAVKNRIYEAVFNLEWVIEQLSAIRPYSQTFDAWVASGQTDESRLLRGRALKDAQIWAIGK
ncbi:AAA-like domain-containing protein, partial [Lyngbya sp. CCY1209]|uniref:AAA-like domain-containing protein n=1 Tax=Lyngbya sp. CCY1209 TaxID=2886103 RepID=UPI002D20850A